MVSRLKGIWVSIFDVKILRMTCPKRTYKVNCRTRTATNNRDISLSLEMFHFMTYTIKLMT